MYSAGPRIVVESPRSSMTGSPPRSRTRAGNDVRPIRAQTYAAAVEPVPHAGVTSSTPAS
jgi:hypothetical protein